MPVVKGDYMPVVLKKAQQDDTRNDRSALQKSF
jgi:hypothetical protein